jgi:PAS domain S-box-containing protein
MRRSAAIPMPTPNGILLMWATLEGPLVQMTNADFAGQGIADATICAKELELRLILDTIPGFVWTMTATGEVEVVNRQMLDYFGATFEELKHWSSFLHEDDRARVIAEWTRTIENTEPYEIEHRLRRADGVYRWFQARGLALRDGEGRVTRWYNLLTEIDDRKRAEELPERAESSIDRRQHSGFRHYRDAFRRARTRQSTNVDVFWQDVGGAEVGRDSSGRSPARRRRVGAFRPHGRSA